MGVEKRHFLYRSDVAASTNYSTLRGLVYDVFEIEMTA